MKTTNEILAKLTTNIHTYSNFFSFEGGEGSGKSTVLKIVTERLRADGYDVFATREPGGNTSEKCEAIRELLYYDKMSDMEPLTDAFLYAASRTQHVQEVILPRLKQGQIVLTDRFVDSSLVYQGLQQNNLEHVMTINAIAICQTLPQTTLFFDVPAKIGLERVFSNRSEETNYLDHRGLAYHEGIYANFKILEAFYHERYVNINATKTLAEVAEQTYQTIIGKLK